MTAVPLTSGWQLNEIYGLEDEAFGPLLVASDPDVGEVNRRAALGDAIDAIATGDVGDPAVLWAGVQVVALMQAGLEPLDESAAEQVENWLVEGEIGPPLVMGARHFADITDPAALIGTLAAVIAFDVTDPAIDAWSDEHLLGAAKLDVVAAYLWLDSTTDEDIAERLPLLVDLIEDLLDDWGTWSTEQRLYDSTFPMDRVLDQMRATEHPRYAEAVALCCQHPYGQQAAALSLTEDPAPQASSTLRNLVYAGVPAAPLGLLANLADRFELGLARAIVPAAQGGDPLFIHVLVTALLEHEYLFSAEDAEDEETLLDVAADPEVDDTVRGVIVGALVENLMELSDADEISDTMAGVNAQMDSLLGRLGMDRSAIPGLPDLPQTPNVAAQRSRLNEIAQQGVVAQVLPGTTPPDWYTGSFDEIELPSPVVEGAPGAPGAPEGELGTDTEPAADLEQAGSRDGEPHNSGN